MGTPESDQPLLYAELAGWFHLLTPPGDDGRAIRFLEWYWDPDPNDHTYVVDFLYLLREPNGEVRTVHDRHIGGLFPRATWQRLIEQAGFEFSSAERPVLPGEMGEIFVGVKPA